MDALNIQTIQANLKRLTPMQLQMEAQSQVVPQWLVALEQQRRATMQEGLATMQSPQQQTTVMEDLATKTAALVAQPAPQEGLAQFAKGGSVSKKKKVEYEGPMDEGFVGILNDLANYTDDQLLATDAQNILNEAANSKGVPTAFFNTVAAMRDQAKDRLAAAKPLQEVNLESLSTSGEDTQPTGEVPIMEYKYEAEPTPQAPPVRAVAVSTPVEPGLPEVQAAPVSVDPYSVPMDEDLAGRLATLDELGKTNPEAAKNDAEGFLRTGKIINRPPAYLDTLEALVNQAGGASPEAPKGEGIAAVAEPTPSPALQPEQGIAQALPQSAPVQPTPAPMALKEETLALPEPTLEALTSQGPADTSPVQQTKFLSPEQQEAAITDYVKANPGTNVTPNTAPPMTQEEYERQMAVVDGLAAIPTTPTQLAPVPQSIPAQQPTLETLQAPAIPKRPQPVVPDDVKSYWDIMKQGGEMPKPNLESFDKKASRKEGQLKYAEDNNLSMALMSASAAILAGESPFTMVNLGKGFTAGLQQYANGRKNINDLQDQIDDVVMARDKALNDQNMREFELQNNRLNTLAMIKQKVDMANAQNATELEKTRMSTAAHLEAARISARAHMAGVNKGLASQAMQEKKLAFGTVVNAQKQYNAAQANLSKVTKDSQFLPEIERLTALREAQQVVDSAKEILDQSQYYAVSVGAIPGDAVSGASTGARSGITVTGEKKVGATTPPAAKKENAANLKVPKQDEKLNWGRPGGQIPDPQIEENRRRAGG